MWGTKCEGHRYILKKGTDESLDEMKYLNIPYGRNIAWNDWVEYFLKLILNVKKKKISLIIIALAIINFF